MHENSSNNFELEPTHFYNLQDYKEFAKALADPNVDSKLVLSILEAKGAGRDTALNLIKEARKSKIISESEGKVFSIRKELKNQQVSKRNKGNFKAAA